MPDAVLLSPSVEGDELFSDDTGGAEEVLTFRVPETPPVAIPKDGGVFGLPSRGSDHPFRPGQGLVARDIIIKPYAGGRESIVKVTYGTSRGGLIDLRDGTFAWSMSREIIDEVIPVQVFTRNSFSARDPSGDPVVQTVATWSPPAKPLILRQRRTVIQARWEVNEPDGDDIQAFANQDGKVHLLNGGYYLFQVGTMQPKQARPGDPRRRYVFVGQWTHDKGTPDVVSSDTENLAYPADVVDVFGFPYLGIAKLNGLMRAPWHYIQLVSTPPNYGGGLHDGSPTAPFRIEQQPEYEFEDEGYQSLPDIPGGFPEQIK